jgi:hypothetical protein
MKKINAKITYLMCIVLIIILVLFISNVSWDNTLSDGMVLIPTGETQIGSK